MFNFLRFPRRAVQISILVNTWYCQSFNFSYFSDCVVVPHYSGDVKHLFICLPAITM